MGDKTLLDARRAADLVAILDNVRDFRESFESENHPFIIFDGICTAHNVRNQGGYEGEIALRTPLAIRMLQWIEAEVGEELASMGFAVPEKRPAPEPA